MRALKGFTMALALGWSPLLWGEPATWQDLPGSVQLEALGDTLRMNGTPMSIRAFRSREPVETLLREVQASWERDPGHQPVQRSRIPNWTVLNQAIGERHRSFQVREQDGVAQGFVAVTSPREARAPVLAVRLPAQVQAVQVIDSVDAGKASQQVLAVSKRSVDATASALGEVLKAQRWDNPMLKKQGQAVRISANRGGEQFDAVLSGQKHGALLMMNVVR
jgi:hypothetical protein